MRKVLLECETRLRALDRGARIAQVRSLSTRMQGQVSHQGLDSAEDRLRHLQDQQEMEQTTQSALYALTHEGQADDIRDRLAQAGFGAPTKPDMNALWERLKARADETRPA